MDEKEIRSLLDCIDNIPVNTKKLATESSDFAEFVAERMDEAGVRTILDGRIVRCNCKSNVGYYGTLHIDADEFDGPGGDLLSGVISVSADSGYYVHGDFYSWVSYPDRDEVLKFCQLAPDILKALAELSNVPSFPDV